MEETLLQKHKTSRKKEAS